MSEPNTLGPRPGMPFLVEQYEAIHLKRGSVPLGLTGLWQLSADRMSLIHKNIGHDLYFLRSGVYEAESVRRVREQFAAGFPEDAVLDFSLPDGDGLELRDHFKSVDEDLSVIVLTTSCLHCIHR